MPVPVPVRRVTFLSAREGARVVCVELKDCQAGENVEDIYSNEQHNEIFFDHGYIQCRTYWFGHDEGLPLFL